MKLLFQIALRNFFASRMNLLIGGIIGLGTLLGVLGGALIGSMSQGMSRSIVDSVAGHIQVYSDQSKEELEFWGAEGEEPALTPIESFSKIRGALEAVPGVKRVVPLGVYSGAVVSGNAIDLALERLRGAVQAAQAAPEDAAAREHVDQLVKLVRQMVRVLRSELEGARTVSRGALTLEQQQVFAQADSEPFWEDFQRQPLDALEFLENRLAPLMSDGDPTFIRYIGTDLDKFLATFDRVELVDGQRVPQGQRGLLLSKLFYETNFKLKIARKLDQMKEYMAEDASQTIATDPQLRLWANYLRTRTGDILFQLDGERTRVLVERLQKALGSQETDPTELLKSLLQLNDANFAERYRLFYEQVAPLVELYRVRLGDNVTIKASSRSGTTHSANVKLYGTFRLRGLEKSSLASELSLMDLLSFRQLYGGATAQTAAELEQLRQAMGAQDMDRSHAEEELFGSGKAVVGTAAVRDIDQQALLGSGPAERKREAAQPFTQQQLDDGLVLSAAVMVDDPSHIDQVMESIRQVSQRQGLGLKVASWQQVSGLVGQLITVSRTGLLVGLLIIFIVALVVINNAVMMATLRRTRELGTMRAIGAQRGFILAVVLSETLLLGAVSSGVAALLGSALVAWLGRVGVPALTEQLYFFFSGPRLYPSVEPGVLLLSVAAVLLMSGLAALYPAILATRVQPVKAMQSDE